MPKTTSRSSRQPKRSRLKSKQPSPLNRYAFPFYSSLPPARRPPHPAGNSGAAFAKAHLGPFPSKPKGNSSFALTDILGAAGDYLFLLLAGESIRPQQKYWGLGGHFKPPTLDVNAKVVARPSNRVGDG